MIPPIPADIWFSVANYLEADELRQLSGVNRVFFTAALDTRYRHVSLDLARFGESDKVDGLLLRLSNPFVAERVRCLNLNFGAEPPKLPVTALELGAIVQRVAHVMSLLCQVTDLALDCNWQGASTLAGKDASPLTASSFFLPIARALWHACLKSLRILDIRANVDVMQMIVRDMAAPNSIQGLRLHFHLRTPCTSRYQDIASLIQRRFPRIKHMTISTSPRLDASFIFPALGRFSNLQTVSLALSMRYRAMELRRVAKFVLENESVQTLSVEGALVAPEDAQSFTELLSPHPRGDTTGPTNLTLSISVLSPQLVDFLAAKLKGLKTLNLIVGKIVDSSFEIDLVAFYSELSQRQYSNWLDNVRVSCTDGSINLLASLAIAQGVSPFCRVAGYAQDLVRAYLTKGHDPLLSVPCSALVSLSLKAQE